MLNILKYKFGVNNDRMVMMIILLWIKFILDVNFVISQVYMHGK